MSRIGKQPVQLKDAKAELKDDILSIKGSKGDLDVRILNDFDLEINDESIKITPKVKGKGSNFWGLMRSLVQNAVIGVQEGFEKRLEMVGVGYRAQKTGKGVTIHAGYSHPIEYEAPEGIDIDVEENTKIVVKGIDKQLVGHVASQIRAIRKPEPYKGKGIKYENEKIRRKAGKAGKAAEETV